MRFKPLALWFIIIILLSLSGCGDKNTPDSPTVAQVGDNIISIKDVESFKKLQDDKLTNKQILDMLVERNILFQEAQEAGIAVSLQDAREYAKEQKNIIDTAEGGQAKKAINDLIVKIGVPYDTYWEDYAPKGYMRALSEAKMKKKLMDEIKEDIAKNNPDLEGDNMQKASDEAYGNKIRQLIEKYNVKYFLQ